MYSTFNEGKAVVIERFNRTLKISCGNILLQIIPDSFLIKWLKIIMKKYTTQFKMTPKEASKDINRGKVYFNIIRKQNKSHTSIKYKKGDKVRISKYKRHFEKGYTPNWTEEIFIIDKINMTNPVTYQVRDLNNENILGSFYTLELSPVKQNIFRIEKVERDNKKRPLLNGLDIVISIIFGFRFLI